MRSSIRCNVWSRENAWKPLIDNVCGHNRKTKTSVNLPHVYSQQEIVVTHTKCWLVVGWTICEMLPFHFSCLLITSCTHDQVSQDLATPFFPYCKQLSGGWEHRDEPIGYWEIQLCVHQMLANKVHWTKTISCVCQRLIVLILGHNYCHTTTVTVEVVPYFL